MLEVFVFAADTSTHVDGVVLAVAIAGGRAGRGFGGRRFRRGLGRPGGAGGGSTARGQHGHQEQHREAGGRHTAGAYRFRMASGLGVGAPLAVAAEQGGPFHALGGRRIFPPEMSRQRGRGAPMSKAHIHEQGGSGWGAPGLAEARHPSGPAFAPVLLRLGHALQAALIVDAHGRVVWMDEALTHATGPHGEPIEGLHVDAVLARLPWLAQAMRPALHGKAGIHEEPGLKAFVLPVFDEQGTLLGACARLQVPESSPGQAAEGGVTRHAPESLAHMNSVLRATFDSIAEGVIVVDLNKRVTAFNKRFLDIWGLTEEMMVDRDAERVLERAAGGVKDSESFTSRIRERFEASEQVDVETVELLDGRILERKSLPQRMGDTIIGRVWSYREVTAERQAEAERERLLREAQEAIRVRDDFLSIAAHELKTPLTPLKLHLQMLRQHGTEGDGASARHVDKSLMQVSRLTGLVNDLLDTSRIQEGRLTLKHGPVVLQELAHDVVSEMRLSSAHHRVEYEAPDAPLVVLGDADRLAQVLVNLMENAFKYSPSGGTVRVRVAREDRHAHVSVQDEGMGIPRDQQGYLFERFFRARNAPISGFGGLGLGLYICGDIVERHGGRLWVESELGRGSTFHFTVPLASS
ncbi:PAS domain-containing sensor histidine kinase [Myxococcus xanthus]|uniref:histidine kinase n=2 Tax=Myxococcus xanthus TaxID=34 RepID=A0AAE6G7U8_MYXXA|nr:PAS domain-containing sensor histidine kinase [Myxococcus xanthus]QDE79509.1 PAS domain-containing sensor histidine kinase [Myxococcus xanthus]